MKARQGLRTAPLEASASFETKESSRKPHALPLAPLTWATLLKTVPPTTVPATASIVKVLVAQRLGSVERCREMLGPTQAEPSGLAGNASSQPQLKAREVGPGDSDPELFTGTRRSRGSR